MSVGKWYGFGQNPQYDEGLRLFGEGQFEAAIPSFKAVMDARIPDLHRQAHFYCGEAYRLRGEQLLRSGDPAGAIPFLQRASDFHPHFADIHLQLARAYRAVANADASLELDQALSINPRYARALFLRGLWRYEGGESDLALLDLVQAGRIQPVYAGDRYQTGANAHAAGNRQAALRVWNELAALESDDASGFVEDGDKRAHDDDWEGALVQYRMALGLAPKYADIRLKCAIALLELNKVTEAAEQLEIALKINENFADAHAYMGIALRRLGDRSAAKEEFRKAVVLAPGHLIAARELERA